MTTYADLSATFPALTKAEWHTDCQCFRPAIDNVTWERKLQTGCVGCSKAVSTHRTKQDVLMTVSAANRRAALEDLIDLGNDVRARYRAYQGMVRRMDHAAHGIYSNPARTPNDFSFTFGGWRIASFSGNKIYCYYDDGSGSYSETPNPARIPFTIQVLNEWTMEYEDQTQYIAAPVGGLLKFAAPSIHQYHGGLLVRRWDPDCPDLEDGDQFYIELETDVSDFTTDVWPSTEEDPPRVSVLDYGDGREPWEEIRDWRVFWGEKKTVEKDPYAGEIVLEAAARIFPKASFFTAEKYASGAWTVVDWFEYLHVDNTHSWMDLTGVSMTGITSLRFTYRVESAAADALPIGQCRCANSCIDYTDSWGQVKSGESGKRHYCARGDASEFSNFAPDCIITDCDQWSLDPGSHMIPQAAIKQLTHGIPFVEKQYVPGISESWAQTRETTPSLLSLAGFDPIFPGGYYQQQSLALQSRGWGAMFKSGTYNVVSHKTGLEFIDTNAADLSNSATWPAYGPGGNNWTRRRRYGAENLSDANDPYRLQRSMVTAHSIDIPAYWTPNSPIGQHGATQRCGDYTVHYCFPTIANTMDEQEYPQGTVQRGFWKADLTSQGSEDGNTVYRCKIHCTNPSLWNPGTKDTATIKAASVVSGKLHLELENVVWTVQTIVNPQVEHTYRACGGHAPLPYWAATYNYAFGSPYGAGMSLPVEGDVAVFQDGILSGTKHWITLTKAGGGATADMWDPAGVVADGTYYAAHVGVVSQPTNHSTWGKKRDLWVVEINGLLQKVIDDETVSWFVGKTVTVAGDGGFHGTEATWVTSIYNSGGDTTLTSGTDYLWLGADGDLYLKADPVGKCVVGYIYPALRDQWLMGGEDQNLRLTLENLYG